MSAEDPSLRQLDVALEEAGRVTARLGSALFELDAERERRAPEAVGFTGTSATRWSEVIGTLATLWAWYAAVSEALDGIRARRGSPRLRQPEIVALWADLHAPALELVAERGSTGSGRVTIAAALDRMTVVYEQAAEAVASLFVVSTVMLPKLTELSARLAALEGEPTRHTPRPRAIRSATAALHERLSSLQNQVAEDPLAVDPQAVAAFAADLDRTRHDLLTSEVMGVEADATLEAIATALAEDEVAICAARSVVEEASSKIARSRASSAALDDLHHDVVSIGEEARRIRYAAADDPNSACAAAAALRARATDMGPLVDALVQHARQDLERRRDLRGRLDAYQAKVRTLGRAEDPVLERIHLSVRDELYTAPCDLDEAERLVAAYASAIAHSEKEDRLQ
jgi:hypothetical protein